jgi:hypothetical protein
VRLPVDRALRQILCAAIEDIASAEQTGRWRDAAVSLEVVVSELRARAANGVPPGLEVGRRERDLGPMGGVR